MLHPDTALYCLEVGQGSSTVVLEPVPGFPNVTQATIIDVGNTGHRLASWLRSIKVVRIAAILLTHNDRDHIGSLIQLVHAYKKKIGKIRFVVDRRKAPSALVPAEQWCKDGWVNEVDVLNTPLRYRPSAGNLILGPDDGCSFRLYCLYPPSLWSFGLLNWLPPRVRFFLGGRNYLSAVLRITPPDAMTPSHALIGGDLDCKGWEWIRGTGQDVRCEVFIVPHHGGPQRAGSVFGALHLAQATRPTYALVSVGTDNTYGLPHEDLLRELRAVGVTVLCTQITQSCLPVGTPPASLPRQTILPRLSNAPRLCASGAACAGTIVVTFPRVGPDVRRLADHQNEVNRLHSLGHTPLCRR